MQYSVCGCCWRSGKKGRRGCTVCLFEKAYDRVPRGGTMGVSTLGQNIGVLCESGDGHV